MLSVDTEIFVQRPEEVTGHILHAARIDAVTNEIYTIHLKDCCSSFEVGSEIRLFFELQRKFMQQSARVEALFESTSDEIVEDGQDADDQTPQILSIVTLGEPASAENRECYRVLTMFTSMTAKIGDEDNCPLLDVSATGFAVMSHEKYESGRMIEVAVYYEGESLEGSVCVQSMRDLGGGQYRYGMHCADRRGSDRALLDGLKKICTDIQRQQLRRLSGKAG
jgi:hypothetical protein